MSPALTNFFAALDEFDHQVPIDLLAERLRRLDLTLDDLQPFIRFDDERYQRNLMHAGPAYEALVLCWKPGQRSPIHDHQGSSCALRVMTGLATETQFDRTPEGLIYPINTVAHPPGAVRSSFDSDIHQVSNLQGRGQMLVTLHIYSPALRVCNVYSLTVRGSYEWVDPVFEFAQGAGI
jgi:cysteine dioxygenase